MNEEKSKTAFHARADQRWREFLKTGKSVSWADGKKYLEALARGEKPKRPKARKIFPSP